MPVARGKSIELYFAVESFTDSKTYEIVRKGDLLRAGHPLLKRHPQFFELADNHVRFDVEAATARPGELR